ncbi:MAG: 5-amino-6-(D-ribitylamino)uracil--L-tyrosine 4-hydroxyphenyl transferase CofH [Euryarchaeota archaeon]|nr:5-amino-6-(D-ribitylamino)uracil--L-tyrosine 4-hydroxyphenyl transferase CofH [Euryarchaeota archaeon]
MVFMLDALLKEIDPVVSTALEKALNNREISKSEALELIKVQNKEFLALILAADQVRRSAVGDFVSFVINRNINFTNVCINDCQFCAFKKNIGDPTAYLLQIDKIVEKTKEAWALGATEVCIQGGLHPELDIFGYLEITQAIKKAVPRIHIHGFSPMEIAYGASKAELKIEEALKMLKEAGLGSIPGTAAEIFNDRIRKIICPKKIDTRTWIEIIKTAHRLGLPTTATILYGHIETLEDRVNHIGILREIQKTTRGFTEFIPLTFMHKNTPLFNKGLVTKASTGAEDLKLYAAARLMLNGYIDNIQVSWVKLGPGFAQVVLNAGANDIGGTLMEEHISKAAGAMFGDYLPPNKIKNLIYQLDRIPAQRTTTYQILQFFPKAN